MKKQNPDLNIFDNADDESIDILAKKYTKLGDAEINRIYNRSREKYMNRTEDRNTSGEKEIVTEVQYYKSPVLRRFIAAAASVTIAAAAVTGGYLIVKNQKMFQDTSYSGDTTEENDDVKTAPFGNLYDDDIRITSPAYIPYLVNVNDEERHKIADVMNSADWEMASDDVMDPDGEYSIIYVFNNDSPYRLEIHSLDNMVIYRNQDTAVRYFTDEEVMKTVNEFLYSDYARENLVWYELDELTDEGVWEHRTSVPDEELNMFEKAEVPEELMGKEIRGDFAEVCYDCDVRDMDVITSWSDEIILGYVEDIDYGPYESYNTVIKIKNSEGKYLDLNMSGGYVSMREHDKDIIGMTGGKYGDGTQLTDEEIDNIYYYIGSCPFYGNSSEENRLVPVRGEYYAFMVHKDDDGQLCITNDLCGILHRNGDDFVQMAAYGEEREYRHFSLSDLIRRVAENTPEPEIPVHEEENSVSGSLDLTAVYSRYEGYYDNNTPPDYLSDAEVILIDSHEKLKEYYSTSLIPYSFADFDIDYFENKKIAVVLFLEGSSSAAHQVISLNQSPENQGEWKIGVVRSLPDIFADEEAVWHIIIEINDPEDLIGSDDKFKVEVVKN